MTATKILIKIISLLLMMCFVMPLTTTFAETGNKYKVDDEGNWFFLGGINEFKGITAQSREEAQMMEGDLYANDYLLCTTDNMTITEAEYEAFTGYYRKFWFDKYMSKTPYYWTKYRVYIYKPSFADFMEQLEAGVVKEYTREEIDASTVVINYDFWDDIEKVGTISEEYNDNIPEWYLSGYMEIHSSVDCEVKFWYSEADRYYVFYITKNTPFKVKVRQGCYHLVEINTFAINNNIDDAGEDTLPYNNQIQIRDLHTFDNPHLIELYDLCDKYDIPDFDISGKPDLSVDKNQDIPDASTPNIDEESTVVKDGTGENRQTIVEWGKIIPWIVVVVVVILLVIYEIKEIKKDDDDDND